ncbi:MAG: Hsp33 family molecular chaperone HslO [Pseudomonadota bacterium]|nr:Hsp33 family molecular chaperone HslO [Pseudomonadota bacterium]
MAQSLKFDGFVTMLISSEGPLGTLVTQVTDNLDIRGVTTSLGVDDSAQLADLVKGAHCEEH